MSSNAVEEYRMSAENRRIAIYLIVGSALILPCAYLTIHLKGGRFVENIPALVVCPLLIALLTYPLFWKIRVDENGLSRRRFWFWDHWCWSDFASGELKKVNRYQFVDARVHGKRRKLSLNGLEKAIRSQISKSIDQHYKPFVVALPEKLHLKTGLIRRKEIILDQVGLTYKSKDEKQFFRWDQLTQVRIFRHDDNRTDFVVMQIELPDLQIPLNSVANDSLLITPAFKNASMEEVNDFVLSHVNSNSIEVVLYEAWANTRVALEFKVKRLRMDAQIVLEISIIPALLVGILVLLVGENVFDAVALILIAGFAGVCLRWMFKTQEGILIKKLENWDENSEKE